MPDASSPIPNPANGDINLGGNRARNAVPSLTDDNYVTRGELVGVLAAVVAASYLLRSGANPMTGNLNGGGNKGTNFANATAAGELLTFAQAVLLAPTSVQTLAGKLRTPATLDADDDLTLVTKAWTLDRLSAVLPLPKNRLVRGVGASTWTVPTGVTRVFLDLGGASGGAGGYGDGLNGFNPRGGDGGKGGRLLAILNVTPGETLRFVVGSKGQNGTYDGVDEGSGGGGGGGSTVHRDNAGVNGDLLASAGGGGGGGGGAEGNNGLNGAPGGAATLQGGNGYRGTGGLGGIGSTLNGGLGGGTNGSFGQDGGTQVPGGQAVEIDYLFPGLSQAQGGEGFPNANGTPGEDGHLELRW